MKDLGVLQAGILDGDLMYHRFLNGDLFVVDRVAKPVNRSVVVVVLQRGYKIKHLHCCPDCVWFEPATRRYQPIRVGSGQDLHVFGVVKHAIHSLR